MKFVYDDVNVIFASVVFATLSTYNIALPLASILNKIWCQLSSKTVTLYVDWI